MFGNVEISAGKAYAPDARASAAQARWGQHWGDRHVPNAEDRRRSHGSVGRVLIAQPAHAAENVSFTINEQLDFETGVFTFTATEPLCSSGTFEDDVRVAVRPFRAGTVRRGQPARSHDVHVH
jgi:hypothetical protein